MQEEEKAEEEEEKEEDEEEVCREKTEKGFKLMSYAYGLTSVSMFLVLLFGFLVLFGHMSLEDVQLKMNLLCGGVLVILSGFFIFIIGTGNISTGAKIFPEKRQDRISRGMIFFLIGLLSSMIVLLSPFLFLFRLSFDPGTPAFLLRTVLLSVHMLAFVGTFFFSLMALYLALDTSDKTVNGLLKGGFWLNIILTLGAVGLFLIRLYETPFEDIAEIRNLHYLTLGLSAVGYVPFTLAFKYISQMFSEGELQTGLEIGDEDRNGG